MKLLLCSDIHCDEAAAARLVELSADADVLVCAGDLAVMRQGLQGTVDVLSAARVPTVLVAGNGESADRVRNSQDAAYRFMYDSAGDAAGYQEAIRSLYRADAPGFDEATESWPADVREYARHLAADALGNR